MTNAGAAYQRDKLQRVGLADRFEVMVAVDDLGVGKPDPRVFHLACERLGVSPGRSLYLGTNRTPTRAVPGRPAWSGCGSTAAGAGVTGTASPPRTTCRWSVHCSSSPICWTPARSHPGEDLIGRGRRPGAVVRRVSSGAVVPDEIPLGVWCNWQHD
ncbi:MAG: HAD family hydrolase [Kineosporiaceae bacterium]|nr:HAD family hydrolase [Kineosporiaceae bacterium]